MEAVDKCLWNGFGWWRYGSTWTYMQQYAFKFYKHQAQATKYLEVQATSIKQVQCPVQSIAIFKLFFVDAINWTFLHLFLLALLE